MSIDTVIDISILSRMLKEKKRETALSSSIRLEFLIELPLSSSLKKGGAKLGK